MMSPIGPIRSQTWLTTCPLFLASLSFHGLILAVMLLVVETHPRGRRTFDTTDADTFSVTWTPGEGSQRGRGRVVDTVIPDAEAAGSLEVNHSKESQPAAAKPRLLDVTQTDPKSVFNAESPDSLSTETSLSAEARFESAANDLSATKRVSPTIDAVDAESRNRVVATSSSSQPNSITSAPPNDNRRDSNRDGIVNRGGGDKPGDGGKSGATGNRTEFFGIGTLAKRIVYLIDASESMGRHNAMELARQKLWSSLQELTPKSQFQVVFFNLTNHTLNRAGDRLRLLPATSANLRLAKQFLTGIHPDSGTNRFAAINHALSLEPDVVYLLTDADAPELSAKDLWEIHRGNKRKAIVHVVEFGVGADLSRDSFLKKLARQNSGEHRYHDLTRADR